MSYKWRLWCETHGWVYRWADIPITLCPINNSDVVDTEKTFQVGSEVETVVLTPITLKTKGSGYTKMASVVYDSATRGHLHRVKVVSNMEIGLTSYNVEVYDRTNNVSLINAEFTNISDGEQNVGLLSSPPDGKVTIEINAKCNGWAAKYANISQVIFCTRQETS